MGNFHLIERLQNAGKYSVFADLSGYHAYYGMKTDWSESQRLITQAIKAAPNDWIACKLYLGWRLGVERKYPESASDFRGLDALERKIEADEEYSFFLSDLYRLRANRLNKERNVDDALKLYDLAIANAEQHENYGSLTVCLFFKANLVKRIDVDKALKTLDRLRYISEEYGIDQHISHYHQEMGHIAMARGEFNLSVHHHIKRFGIAKQLGWPLYQRGPVIASLYNMMGDGGRAMDLITSHRNEEQSDKHPFVLIQEAWAMVNLGNINDAEPLILKAKELILKAHDEVRLGMVYLIEGLMEKAQQDFANAMHTIEGALDIFERYHNPAYINSALIHLCDIEIETFDYEKQDKRVRLSGPWMSRLRDHVKKNKLLAIEGHLKLLRAKFLHKRAQFKQSKKLVTEVKKISKTNQEMEYLEEVAKVLIPKVRK
jgi:tetratricopeptide (TPR) repeat protein